VLCIYPTLAHRLTASVQGCDLPHVEQVVQFMVPKSMSIWSQRAGRGGRNPQIHARAILLVQPSVFQEVKSVKGVELEEGDVKYRKDVEEGLREWIETEGCRRNNSDLYFSDGLPRKSTCPLSREWGVAYATQSQQEFVATTAFGRLTPIIHCLPSPLSLSLNARSPHAVIQKTRRAKNQTRMVSVQWLKVPGLQIVEMTT
jgi:superfamily II DNA/RNA helicase